MVAKGRYEEPFPCEVGAEVIDSAIDRVLSKQSEPTERLLNWCDLFRRARIFFGCGSRRYEAELLFAVQNPCAFGHEAMLARNPFLNLLIGGALAG